MGIRDLWQALSPAANNRTLAQIAVSEGFEPKRRPDCCLHIGVDASVWMHQAQLAINYRRGKGTRVGENPAARILFYRLCRLLTLPIVPIFVFDGPNRPAKKRNTAVKTVQSHWLTLPFQNFIDAFGFAWYTAPGEAEADLAELNRREGIDAIISEDSDTVAFGARCVIRMQNVKDVADRVNVFDAKFIQIHPDVLLDREALFFMAVLCGGDYDKAGLKGCGWKTACRVARTELAHSLFTAATCLPSRGALSTFLGEWRVAFRRLLAQDPDNALERKYPSLAENVTDDFPSIDILLQYAQPITSWTKGQAPDQSTWHLRQPHLAEIGVLCEKYFSWGSSGDMVPRLKGTLWPGVAIRYLLEQRHSNEALLHYANDTAESSSITSLQTLRIFQERLGPGASSTHPDVNGYTIQILTDNIFRDSIARLDATTQSLVMKTTDRAAKISFWIPASVLQAAVPDLLKRYKGRLPAPAPTYSPILSPFLLDSPSYSECESDGICSEYSEAAVSDFDVDDSYGFDGVEESTTAIGAAQGGHDSAAVEFVEGPSTHNGQPMPKFLGFVDLCTPSPSPSL